MYVCCFFVLHVNHISCLMRILAFVMIDQFLSNFLIILIHVLNIFVHRLYDNMFIIKVKAE
jgi:hypothetical protein